MTRNTYKHAQERHDMRKYIIETLRNADAQGCTPLELLIAMQRTTLNTTMPDVTAVMREMVRVGTIYERAANHYCLTRHALDQSLDNPDETRAPAETPRKLQPTPRERNEVVSSEGGEP